VPEGQGDTKRKPPPVLAPGVQLLGDYQGSGLKTPTRMVRLAEGQTIRLTPLLFAVVEAVDGDRDLSQISERVSVQLQREVGADDVAILIAKRLRPAGIVANPDGTAARISHRDPVKALRGRVGVVPPEVVVMLARPLTFLFRPTVVVTVLLGYVGFVGWLLLGGEGGSGVGAVLARPETFLFILALIAVANALHELGHAAALLYGGGRPGRIGVGFYLAYPAFYTEVTEAYQLDRRGRLRVDLGGIYITALVSAALAAVALLTGSELLRLTLVLLQFQIAQQLLPLIRLDGYYVISDLAGVPDLYQRIGPVLRTALRPWRPSAPEVLEMTRSARILVVSWVLVTVGLLSAVLVLLLTNLPTLLLLTFERLQESVSQAQALPDDPLTALAAVLRGLLVLLLPAALLMVFGRIGKWITSAVVSRVRAAR
jgi:putative peptide zinc metalloprotease protein